MSDDAPQSPAAPPQGVPEPRRVTLRDMTDAEFAAWRDRSLAGYADSLARASGLPAADCLSRAEREMTQTLSAGRATAGHRLLVILDEAGTGVGELWLGPHPQRTDAGYVYEIEVDAGRRGEGLGRAAMLAAETVVRAAGFGALGLNVFGFNTTAHDLYTSIGYRVVSTAMLKPL